MTKPRYTLLSGSKTMDVDALATLFKKLTGRDPTPKELKDAKKEFRRRGAR